MIGKMKTPQTDALTICISRRRPNGTEVDLRSLVENAELLSDEFIIQRFKSLLPGYRRECANHPSETKSQGGNNE
jgi:hypothetical protein